MNRKYSSLAVARLFALGVGACSGSSDPTPTPSAEVATTTPAEVDPATEPVIEDPTTPEEAPGADLSLVDACMTLAEPLQEANTAMMGLAQASQDDPQAVVDM